MCINVCFPLLDNKFSHCILDTKSDTSNYPSSHCSLNELFLNHFLLVSCHMFPLNSVFHLFLYSQNCIKEWQSTTFSCQFTTISCHTNNDKKVAQLAYSTNQLTEFLLLELYIPGWRPRLCLSIILTPSRFLILNRPEINFC